MTTAAVYVLRTHPAESQISSTTAAPAVARVTPLTLRTTDGVLVIDTDPTEQPSDLARFKSLAGNPTYFWAMDEGGRATRAYSVRSLDATILVSGSGEVLFRSESLPNPNTLRRAVQKALGQ